MCVLVNSKLCKPYGAMNEPNGGAATLCGDENAGATADDEHDGDTLSSGVDIFRDFPKRSFFAIQIRRLRILMEHIMSI